MTASRARALSVACSLACSLLGGIAHARDHTCGADGVPWIRLRMAPSEDDFRERVSSQLRASLTARQLELCTADEAPAGIEPIATVDISPRTAAEQSLTTISVEDAVTSKRVARDLDLHGIPADGRPLTVALAADELLRASWAELLLADAQKPARPTPEPVSRAIRELPPEPSPLRRDGPGEIGAGLAGEHFGGGHDQLGVDVVGAYFPWRGRFGLHGRLGYRSAFTVSAPDGEVHATALTWGLGLDLALVPKTNRAGLDLFSEAWMTRVSFSADVRAGLTGVSGREGSAFAAYLLGGARAWFALVPSLGVFAQAGGGPPLHAVHATDGELRVTGLSGALFTASLGAFFIF